MARSLPEVNKKPGVCYAWTRDGLELPVVDVTHPAFALAMSEAQQRELVERFVQESRRWERIPKPLRVFLHWVFLRGSILADGVRASRGTFMTGMSTYLLKLGPEMLGAAYSKPIDRKIAGSLPAMGVRLRVQDCARFLAEALAPALRADASRPLHFVNIAGGPAIDTLNALIVLRKEHPDTVDGRKISIDVLDLDDAGAAFGEAALAALSAPGSPLAGMQVVWRHLHYHWGEASELTPVLRAAEQEHAVVMCSSEGGLFEYGSDAEIETNLKVLRGCDAVIGVVGSVTRAGDMVAHMQQMGGAAVRPRGMGAFAPLAERAGWRVERVTERPFSDQVLLR